MTDVAVAPSRPPSLRRRVYSGALWSGASNLVMRVLGIAVTAVVVRFVTPHEFGVFAVALTVHAIASSACELGAASCLGRRDLDAERLAPTVASVALIGSATAAACMFVLAAPLAELLGAPDAAAPVRVLSLTLVLVGIFAVPSALLAREFRQRALFVSSAVGFVPANAVLLYLASHGSGAMAFAWSRVVGHLVAGCVVLCAVRKYHRPGFDRGSAALLVRFGLPLAGANLVNYVLLNADYAFISRLLGPAQLGLYMLAFNVASWSTAVLGSMINGVAMPAMSDGAQDRVRLSSVVRRAVMVVTAVAFPVAALTSALAHPLIVVVFGERWSASAQVLSVLAVYGGLFTLSLVLSNALVAAGRSLHLLYVQLLWIAVLIPSVVLGVRWMGTTGAAWAHVATIGMVVLPAYACTLRITAGVAPGPLFEAALRPAAAAALAGGASWLTAASLPWPDLARLLLAGLVGVAVYAAAAVALLGPRLPELRDRLRRVGEARALLQRPRAAR